MQPHFMQYNHISNAAAFHAIQLLPLQYLFWYPYKYSITIASTLLFVLILCLIYDKSLRQEN